MIGQRTTTRSNARQTYTYVRWVINQAPMSKTHIVPGDLTRQELDQGAVMLLCGRHSPINRDHVRKEDMSVRPCRMCLKVLETLKPT